MSIIVQYILLASIISGSIAVILSLMKNSFLNYRHIHINNVEDFSKHYYRYMLYFWAVGVFVPASELYIEIFKIRQESELSYNLIVGVFCLGIAFGSKYFKIIRVNLHSLFVVFFVIYNSLILLKISSNNQMDYLTLAEFTIVNMISYYVFFSAKYYYIYFLAISISLVTLLVTNIIPTRDFIIYFNSSFIAFIINYVIHYIDLSIKENLLFAYKFVNKGNLLVVGINKDGVVTFVSENIKDILKFDKEEWVGKRWKSEVKQYFNTQHLDGITSIKNSEGIDIFFDWHEELFGDDLVLQVGRDISQLKATETQLRRTNNRLHGLLSNIGDLVFVIDLNFRFKEYYQSENEDDLFLPSSMFIGKTIFEIGFPEEAIVSMTNAINLTLQTNKKSNVEYALPLPVGKQWFNVVISTLPDEDGKPVEVICIARNITERKLAEIELFKTKEILEQTSRVARVGGWEIDISNQKIFFSDINKETIEAPNSFVLNIENALDFFKEGESRERINAAFMNCFKKQIPFDVETQIITLKGNERWVRAMGQAEYENGRCKRLYGTFQDIDEQVKLVQIIKDKELQYRSLISNISSVAFRCLDDEKWTMVFISDAIESLTGFPANDFIYNYKKNYASIIHPDDLEFVNLPTNKDSSEEYSIEYRILDINNNIIWVNEKGRRYFDITENRFLLDGLITNITERKQAEIALQQSFEELKLTQNELLAIQLEQEKFVSLVKYSDAFIAMANMKGEVFFLNEKAKVFSGFSDSFENTFAKDYHSEEGVKLLNNTIIPEVLKNGMWRGEHDIINSKTNEIRYTDATMFLIKNPNSGKTIAMATVQIDITERKKAEAMILENQQELIYKSEILNAIAKTTEKLLISKNIKETLKETFALIGKATNVDRVYFFENDLNTNLISHQVEWVREGILPQIQNPATKNLSFDDIHFYIEPLLQNKIFQKILSELTNQTIIDRWANQQILCVLLLPIIIKGKFYGFIGFDDCTQEQVWSDDKVNILQSLATNIANAIERINNELIIEESENNFRQLNETLEDVFFLFDFTNRKYIYISPSCQKVLGAAQSFFYSGQSYVEEFLFEENQNINYYIESQLIEKGSSEVEYRIKTKEGQIKWIQEKTFAIKNENNQLTRISGICIDITEKKLIQNEIKQLSLVAEKITNGVLISDVDGRVLWANQGFLEMLEINLEDLLGKRPRDLFLPNDSSFEKNSFIMDSNNYTLELEILTFKKNKKWIQINNTSINDEKGHIIQQIEVIIDITERKKAEKTLVEERRLLRAIIDNVPVNIYVKDTQARKTLSNVTDFKYAGFEKEHDVLGKTDFDLYEQNSAQKAYNEDMLVINTKQPLIEYETPHSRKDGSHTWLLISKIPLKNEKEEVTGLVGISIDITERKKSQQLLLESQQKLSSILNSLDEVVWAMSVPDYKLMFVSQSFEKIYGKTTKEWRRNFNIWKELILNEDQEIGRKIEADLLNHGASYGIYRIIGKDNKLKWLETTTKMIKGADGNPFMFMGITTDITDKKLAEQALLKANEETETANKAKAELELRALQMQMNPHFIFNALNSIQSYVMNQDALTANTYLSKFARLIRLFLDSSRSKFIPLAEEINLLNLYIELEKIRFENKFDFEIIIGSQVNKYFEIPTMILQPFVENAINHGLRYKNAKGLLSIKFYHEEGFLICQIEDNGVGRRNADRIQGLSKKGYQSQGLKITAERLTTYNKINDANIVFSIKDKIINPIDANAEVGTVIEIRFPEN